MATANVFRNVAVTRDISDSKQAGRSPQLQAKSYRTASTRPLRIVKRSAAGQESETLSKVLEESSALGRVNEADWTPEIKYAVYRNQVVQKHFPGALSADDFLFRLEVALNAFGFNGQNTIGVVNLCRDESTNIFRNKLEGIFPLLFNVHGLGGGVTCGVTGLKAGLSHSPVSNSGRKKYIFLSCVHIGIDSQGGVGNIARPGQKHMSSACGAMIGALGQFKTEGIAEYAKGTGMHNPLDPEFSIFKQSLALRLQQENQNVDSVDLVELTKVADRQISSELEGLIQQAVDPSEADYAIVTGIQVHSTGLEFDNDEPNLEYVTPSTVSVVVKGERVNLDLSYLPAGAPRQIRQLSNLTSAASMCVGAGNATVTSVGGPGLTELPNNGVARKERGNMFGKLLGAFSSGD
uniref:Low-co2 inducible protein n=1 Tax=Tetraselmis sp. GSL018 TaxID=582737 RepID=A0A061SLV5_9CHLO|eukprot:CAMPEP_0177581004 /NCGR_PEP_ID=MMETSP0419_2-20121207/1897_1 /TAXON_ID=582737 /ORGANISM="Tetraselmis sp., Strain GSL018" /LENGTH=406 /DNA_ID=CAMNT_0019069979 /DNA_START=42 /DNA_END=1262 /DNA_ORIENTATION=-